MSPQGLAGRGAVITGASRGLGLAIARAYVGAGASVVLCGRDAVALARARAEVAALAGPGQTIMAETADVSKFPDVTRVATRAIEALGRVHVLVNNAGVLGPKGRIEDVDWKAWSDAIAINLHGSVLMCRALLPHFRSHRYGKIVQLSGGGATNPLPNLSAYAASKAAIVRFAETLAGETADDHIDVNTVAPGALNTRLMDEVLEAGPEKVGKAFYEKILKQKAEGGAPLERGAALAVWLGSAASDGITGRLISAIWDPWETLAGRRAELAASDIYTLRRIMPKDRGKAWGEPQ